MGLFPSLPVRIKIEVLETQIVFFFYYYYDCEPYFIVNYMVHIPQTEAPRKLSESESGSVNFRFLHPGITSSI